MHRLIPPRFWEPRHLRIKKCYTNRHTGHFGQRRFFCNYSMNSLFSLKTVLLILLLFLFPTTAFPEEPSEREAWEVAPDFASFGVKNVAVLPMDNLSLEPEGEKILYDAVYTRLKNKGYSKIDKEHVSQVMLKLGVKTPGQLAGISLKRLGKMLNADAVLFGQVDQSAAVHTGIYDAVVVSCTLRLVHCESGKTLWRAEQWRTAHRQWQLDPLNMLINFAGHETASREKRLQWLASEMLKTLPDGPIIMDSENLFEKAVEVTTHASDKP